MVVPWSWPAMLLHVNYCVAGQCMYLCGPRHYLLQWALARAGLRILVHDRRGVMKFAISATSKYELCEFEACACFAAAALQ